jgi:hypothetical protein
MHNNSLFNQAGLCTEVLHDNQRALAIAQEFLKRFPQSDRPAAARQLISNLEEKTNRLANRKADRQPALERIPPYHGPGRRPIEDKQTLEFVIGFQDPTLR